MSKTSDAAVRCLFWTGPKKFSCMKKKEVWYANVMYDLCRCTDVPQKTGVA
ncbi:MAG TPA: hypothetical protein VF857_04650 [Spirochaetota bacterium]